MRVILLSVLFFGVASLQYSSAFVIMQSFDKTAYYRVLKNGNIHEISDEISLVKASSLKEKNALEGTLLIKKAGLLKVPKEKLDNFKSGRIKLETALHDDSSNVECHFLRLIIQEHAPKIVKYSKNISDDVAFIKKNYKELSPEVQKILIDYSNNSKVLKPTDFQP